MTFCLDATIIGPDSEKNVNNAIILLHGYGGDGKDISMLCYNWKRYMPNTIFICPNGHEPCVINPSGFPLSTIDPLFIIRTEEHNLSTSAIL